MSGPILVEATFAALSLTSLTGRPSGLVSWGDGDDQHVTLGHDRWGRASFEVRDGERRCELVGAEPLVPGRWARLTLHATGSELQLSVDGVLAASASWYGPLPSGTPVLGRRADQPDGADESSCGQLADVQVLTDPAAAARRVGLGRPDLPDLDVVAELRSLRGEDPNRPEYHFMPPANWMNEPHGAIQIGGVHHLFYQANRRGPFWGAIEWGHAISKDLVHWTHLPPALAPDRVPVAPDGIWSGSSVLGDDGEPLLFFTAGDFRREPDQAVAVARRAGDGWVADDALLVVMPDEPDLAAGQFRDPFVWREESGWFMLVGAGVVGRGGTALLYRSVDGERWTVGGRLLVGDQASYPETGEMWELPVLLPVHGDGLSRHVLLVCPWWRDRPADTVVEVVHWIGRWDPVSATFTPDHPEPRRFDVGRHFTGPSGNVLDDGRTILWSIAQDGRSPEAQYAGGWAHNAGLPLELSLANGRLAVQPVRELEALRTEQLDAEPFSGMQLELDLQAVLPADDDPLRIRLTVGDELSAELVVDPMRRVFGVLRPGAAAYDVWRPMAYDEGPAELPGGELRLRVFVDHSIVEAYLGDHLSLTTRIDVSSGPPALTVAAGRRTRITTLQAWLLAGTDN
ncbi:sucrose-6-phosphate hydrolase SacC (GH32 family) [Kribbella sp. VKM Ac-2527]|uniref:beta-fructofuranosidase n=1 Tax=Kribbella caucasensis TaxID=2512215 RepID=A0A4V3C9M5_9ACTN|nr:GH32 C-terminal domain-containing protein [Kribbella sp. VKM Ac-2527]TDO46177.1 sucrose-6-phosphate hydrolase SacC (GH32 family) [Kribbella sp. VKM Ac-2527]